MINRTLGSLVLTSAVLGLLPAPSPAQSAAETAPRYVAQRTPDGQPDLRGIWQVLNSADWDLQAHASRQRAEMAGVGVVEGDEIPYQEWAAAKKSENFENRGTADPLQQCLRPGIPRLMYLPYPFQVIQFPEMVLIVSEFQQFSRFIYTDGKDKHPDPGVATFWHGHSIGRWEGDTLVVDTTNFTDQTWFDRAGNFHSEDLHVVERYTRAGPDHVTYEVTIEDPKVFTRPWKMSMPFYRRQEPNLRLLEYDCYVWAEKELEASVSSPR